MPLTITAGQVRDMATLSEEAIAETVDGILAKIQKDIISKASRMSTMQTTYDGHPFNTPEDVSLTFMGDNFLEIKKRVENSLKDAGFGVSYNPQEGHLTINWR